MPELDTIVATATPAAESALAIVRMSGPACPEIARAALHPKSPTLPPRAAVLATYVDVSGEPVDDLIAILYPEGSSFTGDAMLELICHGNPLISQKLVEDAVARGCRIAEPGEFTRNAFLNGKIDLSQAEAVADLIHARSDKSLQAARKQLSGSVGQEVNTLITSILQTTAHLEAYIDFPEEDLPPEDENGPLRAIGTLISSIEKLVATQHYRQLLHDGVRLVILGVPNAGKSSLLNALTGEDRVIVSESPGTTRDYIIERMMIGPYLVNVTDTAGIREGGSAVEQEGIRRSIAQARQADLCVWALDQNVAPPPLPHELEEILTAENCIVLENKSDLPRHPDTASFLPGCLHMRASALTGDGIHALRAELRHQIEGGVYIPEHDAVLVSARHADALNSAKGHMQSALSLLNSGDPAELAAQELHLAIDAMSRIVGKIDNEQMLDELFQSFCIGK